MNGNFRLSCILIGVLVSGCVDTVKISYPAASEIHPEFDRTYTSWNGERVEVNWTHTLQAESAKYLAKYDRVLLANSIREKGLRNEYKIAGKGTPLVVYTKNRHSRGHYTKRQKSYANGFQASLNGAALSSD